MKIGVYIVLNGEYRQDKIFIILYKLEKEIKKRLGEAKFINLVGKCTPLMKPFLSAVLPRVTRRTCTQ